MMYSIPFSIFFWQMPTLVLPSVSKPTRGTGHPGNPKASHVTAASAMRRLLTSAVQYSFHRYFELNRPDEFKLTPTDSASCPSSASECSLLRPNSLGKPLEALFSSVAKPTVCLCRTASSWVPQRCPWHPGLHVIFNVGPTSLK